MNKTIKELVSKEQDILWNSWHNYEKYHDISNIEEFGKIRLLYKKIETGHKARAKKRFDNLSIDTKTKLPKWLWNYFYSDIVFKTFKAWNFCGRVVKKGERSFRRNKDGVALFAEDQTTTSKYYNEGRTKLINTIYSANDDAPYDDDYTDYDKLNKELQSWNGTVQKWDAPTITEYEESMYYEYEPEW